MQETIAYGTLMMTVGLVLSLPRLSMGRHIGPGAVAAVGVLVLLTTGVISPADFVGSFQVLSLSATKSGRIGDAIRRG